VFEIAKQKIETAKSLQYQFESNWDTRLNQRKFSFMTEMFYSKLEKSHHGFGFFTKNNSYESWYDGINYKEFDYDEKMIINYNSEE